MPKRNTDRSPKGGTSRTRPSSKAPKQQVSKRMSGTRISDPAARARELRRSALIRQLSEVHRLLEVQELKRTDLSEVELRALERQFEAVMEAVTGLDQRMRALVWLESAIRQIATDMFEVPGLYRIRPDLAATKILFAWNDFLLHFPRFEDKFSQSTQRLFIRYIESYSMSLKRGRPSKKESRPAPKWEALYDLAVHLHLIPNRKDLDEFMREVRRAKAKRRRTIFSTQSTRPVKALLPRRPGETYRVDREQGLRFRGRSPHVRLSICQAAVPRAGFACER